MTHAVSTGVCLLYMGGPADLDAVTPFLPALLADRDPIPLPGGPPSPLLGTMTVPSRTPRPRGYHGRPAAGPPAPTAARTGRRQHVPGPGRRTTRWPRSGWQPAAR